MFYAIIDKETDLYLVMDVMTGELEWGAKDDCMVFNTRGQADSFAYDHADSDWEVVEVEFMY